MQIIIEPYTPSAIEDVTNAAYEMLRDLPCTIMVRHDDADNAATAAPTGIQRGADTVDPSCVATAADVAVHAQQLDEEAKQAPRIRADEIQEQRGDAVRHATRTLRYAFVGSAEAAVDATLDRLVAGKRLSLLERDTLSRELRCAIEDRASEAVQQVDDYVADLYGAPKSA